MKWIKKIFNNDAIIMFAVLFENENANDVFISAWIHFKLLEKWTKKSIIAHARIGNKYILITIGISCCRRKKKKKKKMKRNQMFQWYVQQYAKNGTWQHEIWEMVIMKTTTICVFSNLSITFFKS